MVNIKKEVAFTVCREMKTAGGDIKNRTHPNLSNGGLHDFHGKESWKLLFACDLSLPSSCFNSDFNCSLLTVLIFSAPNIYGLKVNAYLRYY